MDFLDLIDDFEHIKEIDYRFFILGFGITILFLILGYVFGKIAEESHLKSLEKGEKEFSDILLFSSKNIPEAGRLVKDPFVTGMVVISHDYFSGFLAIIRKLLGGEIKGYEKLVCRARREAILRLKKKAREQGAKAVYNLRIETSSVSKGQFNSIVTVELFVYGTAIEKVPYENHD